MSDRYLVALDGSESSFRALDAAARLAGQTGAQLEVVSVLDLEAHDVYSGFYLTEEQVKRIEDKLKNEVLAVARHHVPDDGPRLTTRLLRGHAVSRLLDEAGKPGVTMLFVGRTGKGPLQKLLEGSVSRSIAKLSPIPVTVVA